MSLLFISANKDTLFPLLSQTIDFKNVLCPDTLPAGIHNEYCKKQ
jgi:hypothetical protein